MNDYMRMISYIYSYEKGVKTKNSGFAKIESRNGVCKINISLRISEILVNEVDDNALEVFLFCRKNQEIEKIFLGKIRISSECSMFKAQLNADRLGNTGKALSDVTGIFVCSKAFLHKKSQINIIYASEWDDIPIDVNQFIEENHGNVPKVVSEEPAEMQASEIDEDMSQSRTETQTEDETEFQTGVQTEVQTDSQPEVLSELETEKQTEIQTNIIDNEQIYNEQTNNVQTEAGVESQIEKKDSMDDAGVKAEEMDSIRNSEDCINCLEELLSKQPKQETPNQNLDTADYFKMLSSCYPKVRVNEINGECIKITPHDISYLPKCYWHLCNNSFLLHGFYNYKHLLLCEKTVNNEKRYMICVPGMFHAKEQTMAKMFGFTEFEGRKQNGAMSFGYWCIYL